jgi:hypothetical protein
VLIENTKPAAIARAINSFDASSIDDFKRNAIAASEELCWQKEGQKLVRACNTAIARHIVHGASDRNHALTMSN